METNLRWAIGSGAAGRSEMAATCEGCGVAIEDGAFLGRCPDCNQKSGDGASSSMVAKPGGRNGLKVALIVGCALFLLFALMMLVAL